MHGGRSTGPRTAAGRARIGRAQWRHGYYTQAAKAERAQTRQLLIDAKALMAAIDAGLALDAELS
jgi:hypothetical protein